MPGIDVYVCPGCGNYVRISKTKWKGRHKMVLFCLDCREAPEMKLDRTEIRDGRGKVTGVIV